MEREYGQLYERLYREHWWWRAREEFLMRQLRSLDLPPHPRVLDVGCGNGLFFDKLSTLGGEVEGIESDAALVSSGGPRNIHIGPFDRTFAPDKRYSLILMLDVLEHLSEREAALEHAATLLEPGGYLIVTVPAFLCLWTTHDDINHHYTRYTKATFLNAAAGAPVSIVCMRYFFHFLAAIKLVVRIKERMISTRPQPPRIPSKFVNRTMLELCRIEQRIAWLSLPFGSSLLAVTRKTKLYSTWSESTTIPITTTAWPQIVEG